MTMLDRKQMNCLLKQVRCHVHLCVSLNMHVLTLALTQFACMSMGTGEEFLKIEDEDDQGWCRGMMDGGKEGLYPANYVEVV